MGQAKVLQFWIWLSSWPLSQVFPPNAALVVTARVRCWTPLAQVLVQMDQADHGVALQSMGHLNRLQAVVEVVASHALPP
jgi:hypothetical protein